MYSLTRSVTFAAAVIVCVAAFGVTAQERQPKAPSGSISGRVMIGDLPARGVSVLLVSAEQGPLQQRPVARAATDHEGLFQMTGVPAGQYFLQSFAPTLVAPPEQMYARLGKMINLSDGESVEGVDLSLSPGGVITGRLTNADGQPFVQENVRLFGVSEDGRRTPSPIYLPNSFMFTTDDRGVYRLFGVAPGRYIVGAGVQPNFPAFNSTTYHRMTYHPDTIDEAKATVIEVAAGTEATGVDIVFGGSVKAYSASGRIVDTITGKPVAGMPYGYGAPDPRSGQLNVRGMTSSTSNAKGEFRLEGITPGQYAAFASPPSDSQMYSDTAPFTVSDSDVTGLVVKVHLGSSITGNVIIEGAEGQKGAPRFSEFRLAVSASSLNVAPRYIAINIAPDGSFRVSGLPRGMATFNVGYPPPKGSSLIRVERDGVVQKGGIEVGASEEISGVKIIFGYGTGSIRGQVKFEGEEVSARPIMFLNIQPVGSEPNQGARSAQIDVRGRFLIEGLQPGQYELSLFYQALPASPVAGGPQTTSKVFKQTVAVTNGLETPVTMRVNLNENNR